MFTACEYPGNCHYPVCDCPTKETSMEEFWVGISLSEINGITRHSKVTKSHADALDWCEMTMKGGNEKFFILQATHQVKRQIAPVEVIPLVKKIELPKFSEEPELHLLYEHEKDEVKSATTSKF